MNNHRNVISEQVIIERFGEPISTEELNSGNWSDYKVPEKKAKKKKGGPKLKFWGQKHSKRVKPKLVDDK